MYSITRKNIQTYKNKKIKTIDKTIDEVEQYFPGFKAFIDSTEQEIPRPENKIRRKNHYSGKKKKHTVKTQFMVNSQRLILHKTRHNGGRQHDYHLYKHNHPVVENYNNMRFEIASDCRPYHDLTYHSMHS